MQRNDVVLLRKTIKNAYLRVTPAGEVLFSVPEDMDEKDINRILAKRSEWIDKQLNYFKMRPIALKEYVSGESVEYLGRNYRLKVIETDDESVKLSGGYVQLHIRDKLDFARKQKMIARWYRERAAVYFHKAIGKYEKIVGKEIDVLKIRRMKTRWGSCNPKSASINLNLELIKKSRLCIDYVVFHEMAHLIHPNHSPRFYNYLSLHMPDWRLRKKRLES
jgi:predicted metal-dependent hydrolase